MDVSPDQLLNSGFFVTSSEIGMSEAGHFKFGSAIVSRKWAYYRKHDWNKYRSTAYVQVIFENFGKKSFSISGKRYKTEL